MIKITDRITLDEAEIVVTFIRASGPGGQNVNKVRAPRNCASMCAARRAGERIAGARLTKDGETVLTAGTFRTQEANRKDAINRLVRMIRQAAIVHPVHTPTLGAKQGRLTGKAKRGEVKRQRRSRGPTGD